MFKVDAPNSISFSRKIIYGSGKLYFWFGVALRFGAGVVVFAVMVDVLGVAVMVTRGGAGPELTFVACRGSGALTVAIMVRGSEFTFTVGFGFVACGVKLIKAFGGCCWIFVGRF